MNKAIGGLLSAALFAILLAVAGSDNSAHAQQLQGDVDCDGDIDASDALWILRDAAGLPVSADCMEAAGDVNCDGVIDVLDALAVLLHAAGLPPLDTGSDCVPIGEEIGPGPEPSGPPLTAEMNEDVSIAVDLTVRQDCVGGRSHLLSIEWDVFNATGPVGINITAMPSAGGNILGVSDELSGSESIDLDVPAGGHVIVVVSVDTPQGFASDVAAADLAPCFVIAIPDPGEGFGPGDITIPPGSGTGGDLREVDVAHLGGSPQGPAEPIIVSAAGTGSSIKLTSWTLRGTPPTPFKLDEAPPFFGSRVRLHVLTPDVTPELEVELLISASIHNDILWLTTWRVGEDGSFTQLDTRGFGPNTRFGVEAFSIDHRPIEGTAPGGQGDTFQVVTPVIGEAGRGGNMPQRAMRLVSWSVNAVNGGINGLQDSGNWGDPSGDPVLDIAHQEGPLYVVGYKDGDDNQVHQYWSVQAPSGFMSMQGSGVSGLDIRGVEPVTINNLTDLRMLGLTEDGFITATRLGSADPPALASWETRVTACDAGCYNSPFKIASDLDDMQAGLGVDLGAPPTLTDTRQDLANDSDRWGSNMATGDFDGDGLDDLAVGVPQENAGGVEDSGQVDVMYGFADAGSTAFDNDFWTQASSGVATDPAVNELFGDAIAAGNFNGDAYDDLAIGVPREDIGNVVDAGAVHVLYGSAEGLTSDGIQFFHMAAPEILKQPGDNDLFGEALTAGDFDGDGRDDLAIGIPYHNLPGIEQAGAVQVLYGAPGGLTGDGEQLWHQGSDGIIGDPEEDDIFGRPLATGDFDGDGRDDLVAGVTGEDVGDLTSAGSLNVIYGSPAGLASAGNQLWNLDEMGGADGADAFDFFPGGLAAGDFDGGGEDELAIGVPNQDRPGAEDAGAVYVLAGSGGGLTSAGMQIWDQDTPAFNAEVMEFDGFGASLAAGNFNSLGPLDLAIGIPSLDTKDVFDAGGVRTLLGGPTGLVAVSDQVWMQGAGDLGGTAEDGEFFGGPLASADFDGDGFDDLAAAATLQNVEPWVGGPVSAGGAITIIYGGHPLVGLIADGNQTWTQGIERRIRAMLTDALWEQQFGIGGGVLYERMPAGENIQNHTASVTKVMTLLLAVEAINAGEVDLDDVVEVSMLAADTGGSHCDPDLATGDLFTLRFMLHAMMMCSDNKASVAIAEHVARAYLGDDATMEDFVDMMNVKAEDIEMINTIQGHPAGSSATTPQDQITLWMYAIQHELFRQYAEVKLYNECGETIDGAEKCYFIEKHSDSGYPGLGGWKGGNGLVGEGFGLPACVSCLTAEADRLTRKLVTHFQQSGDRWGDADRLFDWGYKTLFAPDLSVDAADDGGPVLDFAIDNVGDSLAVTAVIESAEDLKLCAWDTLVESEQAGVAGCETETIDELPPGPAANVRRALVDMALLSTTFAEGDYVTAYSVPAGIAGEITVMVQVWRVGPTEP